MNQQTSLKRNLFAQHIRQQQRQRIKKEIRERFIRQINQEQQQQEYYNNYDDKQFQNYRYECKCKNFTRESIENALNYLFSKNVAKTLIYEKNFRFLDEVTERLCANIIPQPWQLAICSKIHAKLEELIKLQIMNSQKDQQGNIMKTRQLSDLSILQNCFDGLLSLIEKHKCYHEVWIVFSHLKNQSLKNYSFQFFEAMFKNRYDNLSSEEITVIICTLDNYVEDCPNKMNNIYAIIDTLFAVYDIRPFDTVKLVDILLDILTQPQLKQKIQILVESTNLIQNITVLLDKGYKQVYKNSFDVASKIAYFVGKLYSVEDEELSQKIYMKNIMILSHIRSWLPIQPNVNVHMLEHLGNGTLTHNSHKCTMYMIFSLTNIVVSDSTMLETILVKTDIYRALILLYRLLPVSCRQQISIFLFNAVNRSDRGSLRIMLESKLPQVVVEMLKQSNSTILRKALGLIIVALQSLEEGSDNGNHEWLYTRKRLQVHLESLGVMKLLDSLVTSPESKIAELAIQTLENLQ